MCGIFGQILWSQSVDLAAALAALETLSQRGPGGSAITLARPRSWTGERFLDPNPAALEPLGSGPYEVFLGHRRAKAAEAVQPLANEDGTVWVVADGEIQNHQELRRMLQEYGHNFHTEQSDAETLVHGYEQWGVGMASRLAGVFAFAVVDLRIRRLLLVRDRVGERPIHYVAGAWGLAFASEPAALQSLRQVASRGGNEASTKGFSSPWGNRRGVRTLEPAQQLLIPLDELALLEPETYATIDWPPTVRAA
jgi:asparagine synthetase B (glutamine-hydrolysing)